MFFLPPKSKIYIESKDYNKKCKICLYIATLDEKVKAKFEVQQFNKEELVPRGELSSNKSMATLRTVWTGIKNGYFMSGFTRIPNEALKQGVVTSVNLEEEGNGMKGIYPHVHPEYPEVYIFCIDDPNYAITQYLVNEDGQSVSKDLTNGEGVFFPGNLGHMNFAKPYAKELSYCSYMWMICTYGKIDDIKPITLKF